jgi:hypothetical protein
MTFRTPLVSPRFRLESPSGLSAEINANGSIRRLNYRDILLNLFLGNEVEGGPANLYLRRHGTSLDAIPLLGPRSPAVFFENKGELSAWGKWRGIRFIARLVLADSAPAWFWHVGFENAGAEAVTLDLIYAQDLGLAHYGAVRLNEYYVSQYLDHSPLAHAERGWVLASRQNQAMGGRNPWCLIGALGRSVGFATDALQVHALATRAGRIPVGIAEGLPGIRRQHEHAMAAIQDVPLRLEPGETAERGFFGWFEADHAAATSESDLAFVDRALALPEAFFPLALGERAGVREFKKDFTLSERPPFGQPRHYAESKPHLNFPHPNPLPEGAGVSSATLFSTAPLLEVLELTEADITHLFDAERREEEPAGHAPS